MRAKDKSEGGGLVAEKCLCLFVILVVGIGCSSKDRKTADAGVDARDVQDAGALDGGDDGRDAGADGAEDAGDQAPEPDWVIGLASVGGEPLPAALLGHYDLSGALFAYHQVPGLVDAMRQAGFSEWRVGVGRWEAATLLLPALTDGTPCQIPFPEARAPDGFGDLDLIAARDWFTDDGQPVTEADTLDDGRYALGYLRAVLDVADAFGAEPYVSIDSMPRALAQNRDPVRSTGDIPDACSWTFTNRVSNTAPQDPAVFAAAVEGLVARVVGGSQGQPGRAVRNFEIWNEPEFCQFWDPLLDNQTGCAADDPAERMRRYFDMAIPVLLRLQAWRQATPSASDLRFGLGSFAAAETAAAAVAALDDAGIPLDFISFHAYHNDPMAVVDKIRLVAEAVASSANLQDTELVLAEWGPALGNQPDPARMDQALHALTVLASGAAAGLDRSHRAIFWAFYPGIEFGLVEHDVAPRPLHRAYRLLAAVITPGAHRLAPVGVPDGVLDDGMGAVLAAQDDAGATRVLLVNRNTTSRTVRIELDGAPAVPARLRILDDPESDIRDTDPAGEAFEVPARSVVLVEL